MWSFVNDVSIDGMQATTQPFPSLGLTDWIPPSIETRCPDAIENETRKLTRAYNASSGQALRLYSPDLLIRIV